MNRNEHKQKQALGTGMLCGDSCPALFADEDPSQEIFSMKLVLEDILSAFKLLTGLRNRRQGLTFSAWLTAHAGPEW